jgi:hypothetical protein
VGRRDTGSGAGGLRRFSHADAGGAAYLGDLVTDTPSAANVAYYARIIRERALLRRQVETRPRAGGFAEASATRVELGESDGGGGGHLEIIVAVRAAELSEMLPSACREFGIHLDRRKDRNACKFRPKPAGALPSGLSKNP